MDETLGLPAGTLRGHEKLEELENWDSTSLITFISLADANWSVDFSRQIVNCSTVADLLRWLRWKGVPLCIRSVLKALRFPPVQRISCGSGMR